MLNVNKPAGLISCPRFRCNIEILSISFKTLFVFLFFALWIGLSPANVSAAQQIDSDKAYKIKAAFLLNFAKFISWPEGTYEQDHELFKICVLGDDPFGSALSSLSTRTLGNKKIKVFYADTVGQVENCQLLFVSTSEKDNLDAIKVKLGNRPVVMVSDINGFVKAGGTFEFVTRENTLTFNINLQRARAQGLTIHSALLNLALEVVQ